MGLSEKQCKYIKRFLVGFAVVVTIAVIIIMVVNPSEDDEEATKVNIVCLKTSSDDDIDMSTITCSDYPCITEYEAYIDELATDSESWDAQQSSEYLQTFADTDLGQCLQNVNTTCTYRPAPSCYLPPNVIEDHLEPFLANGASFVSNTKYASMANFSELGYEADDYDPNGVQWVSPYDAERQILLDCGTSTGNDDNVLSPEDCVLTALGIEISAEDIFRYDYGNPTVINRVMQVNIYKTNLEDLNLRMPSGNEQGVDESSWRPGGYSIDGVKVAVVDMIMEGDYCWNPVAQPNGTFCFGNCDVVCNNFGGCSDNSCVNLIE